MTHTIAAIAVLLAACSPEPGEDTQQPGDSRPALPGDSLDSRESRPPDSPPPGESGDTQPSDSADSEAPDDTGDTGEPSVVEQLDPWEPASVRFDPDPLVAGATVTITYEGELASAAKALELYHGFDDGYPYTSLEMIPAGAGFEVEIEVPEGTRSLHVSFAEPEGDADDNDGRLWSASTRFPYLGPWLGWGSTTEPGSGVMISWETTQPCLGVVEYGSDAGLGSWAVGEVSDTVHHVELGGLIPGSELHYRVWDSAGSSSETFVYPVPDTTAPFDFVAMSDLQPTHIDGRLADTVAELVAEHADAAFILVAGDLVTWDHPVSWWISLEELRELLPSVPLVPVPGNHDSWGLGSSLEGWDRYIAPPIDSTTEPWYTVDFGDLHLVALHSSDAGSLQPAGAQYTWVQDDLNGLFSGGVRTADHVLACFHVPPYNVGTRHFWEQENMRPVTALFDGTVDWHIAGHEHLYQRFEPLRHDATLASSGSYGTASDQGVGYLVLPTSGSSPGNGVIDPKDPDAAVRDLLAFPSLEGIDASIHSEMGFVSAWVDGPDLTFTAWATGTWSKAEAAEVLETVTVAGP